MKKKSKYYFQKYLNNFIIMKLKKIKYTSINKRNFHDIFFPPKIRKTILPQFSESYITPINNNNRNNIFINLIKKENKNRNDNYISNNLNYFLTNRLNQNRILYKIRNKNKNSDFLFQKLKEFSLTKRNYSSTTRNNNILMKSTQKINENLNKKKINQTTQNLKPLSNYSPYLLGTGEYSLINNLQKNKYNNYTLYNNNNISSNASYSILNNSNMKKSKSCRLIL